MQCNVLNISPLRARAHLAVISGVPALLTSNISRDLDSSPLVLLPIAVGCCCPQLAVEWDGHWTIRSQLCHQINPTIISKKVYSNPVNI